MSILTVLGTRPQFVKASMVSMHLALEGIDEIVVETGQHYDPSMRGIFFEELGIKQPDHSLNVGSSSHGIQTGSLLMDIEKIIDKENPLAVMVYGDTNSTLAGALAAAKLNVPVIHVEAGLRSFNRNMPEEVNRIVTDHISSVLFPPSTIAFNNLINEGLHDRNITISGDVMYDSFKHFYDPQRNVLGRLNLSGENFILATFHRPSNVDSKEVLTAIVDSLIEISNSMHVVIPLHPRTRKMLGVFSLLNKLVSKNITVVEPMGYLDMISLESQAKCIVTDSGGVQKEAYFARTPCITLRLDTEWTELVDTGWNVLINPLQTERVVSSVLNPSSGIEQELYGSGQAAQEISNAINAFLKGI